MMRTSLQKIMDGNMIIFSPPHQPDGVPTPEKLHQVLQRFRENRTTQTFEWLFQRPDQSLLYSEVTLTPVDWEGQEQTFMLVRDISEQKQKEAFIQEHNEMLNQKNEELQKYINSNMQLENFAYLASHDLKTPIRTLVSFSQLLERSAGEKTRTK